jgi:hypothetical protein
MSDLPDLDDAIARGELLERGNSSLLEMVDHVLDKGAVVDAELILGLADVDLIYVRLSALICAADRVLPVAPRPKGPGPGGPGPKGPDRGVAGPKGPGGPGPGPKGPDGGLRGPRGPTPSPRGPKGAPTGSAPARGAPAGGKPRGSPPRPRP